MTSTPFSVPLRDLEEVRVEARHLLTLRQDEIKNGKLQGEHWFVAILREALLRRQYKSTCTSPAAQIGRRP